MGAIGSVLCGNKNCIDESASEYRWVFDEAHEWECGIELFTVYSIEARAVLCHGSSHWQCRSPGRMRPKGGRRRRRKMRIKKEGERSIAIKLLRPIVVGSSTRAYP